MTEKLSKENIEIAEWEYEYQQRGEQPVLLSDFFARSLPRHLFSYMGEEFACSYLYTDSSKGFNNKEHKARLMALLQKKITTQEGVEEVLRHSIDIPKSFNELVPEVVGMLEDPDVPNVRLAELWEKMDEHFLKVIPWFYYPWYLSKENMLTDRVKAGLERYRGQMAGVDFDEALLAVVFPTKKTAFQLEQEKMLELVKAGRKSEDFPNDPEFKEKAREYLKEYDWLTTFIFVPLRSMSYEELVARVRRAMQESFEETMAAQRAMTVKNEALAREVLDTVKDDAKLRTDIENARELGYVLTAGIEEAYISSARYLGLQEKVAERLGIAFEDTKYLLSEEIVSYLREGKTFPQEELALRRKGFVMMTKGGERSILFGDEAHEISRWIDTELTKVDKSIKELKGQPACKGYAKGKARIALTPVESHELQEGEILVCPMTNPDYVPAMRRSGAIVTDEGGLLSHAAIMSREFGKPCVIATKIATKVLKDGQTITVDARTGLIIIED